MDERSLEAITRSDLKRLAKLAREEREDFFGRHPEWSMLYRRRVIASALCGDAALHYLNGTTGVAEFEVWTFYAQHAEAPYPPHQVSHRDFGPSRFGSLPQQQAYAGRRVVLTGRSLDCAPDDSPVEVLQRYLRRGETPSARELREKAVVLIEPEDSLGYVVWPTLVVGAG